MGEEVKNVEEEKEEEAPAADEEKNEVANIDCGEKEEKKDDGDDPQPPPPPEEIVMRVYMHCEGCARKVHRSLNGFQGVEEVRTDCRTHEVVVKGKVAAAEPMKVVERVQRKTGRKVELRSPIPPPEPEKEDIGKEEEKPKVEERNKEEPQVIAVVLKVHMHCEACFQEIKKRILKMKGVQSVDPVLKASEVTVKGVFEPPKLLEHVYRRTGKHALIVKQEIIEEEEENPDEKDANERGEEKDLGDGKGQEEEKEGDGRGEQATAVEEGLAGGDGVAAADSAAAAAELVEVKKNEVYYHHHHYYYNNPSYAVEYGYPPQMFSDENPNACAIM